MIAAMGLLYSGCGPSGQSQSEATATNTTGSLPDTQTKTPDEGLIVAGKSVGPIQLGDPDSLLLDWLGKPDYSDAAMGKAVLAWYQDSATHQVAVFTARNMGNDETARIKQIRVTSPYYTTAEGLCANSSAAQISDHYDTQQVETYAKDGQEYTVLDTKQGIAFELNPRDSCVAIIVYEPVGGVSSYMPLRALE